jgi:heme exporter protein B
MRFLRHAAAVAAKDLRVELRTREIVTTMVFFAAVIVVIFSFAFAEDVASVADVSSGVLWISVAFAGSLGLARAFDRERDGSTMRGLLLSPADRGAIFVGKAVSVLVSMILVEIVVVPLIMILFDAPIGTNLPRLLALLFLTTTAFAIVGSVFAGMLLPTRARAVLLPIALYPILTPAFLAATKGTAAIWIGGKAGMAESAFWLKFLAVYDSLFLLASLWMFESLVVE